MTAVTLILWLLTALFSTGNGHQSKHAELPDTSLLCDGDIIFRDGKGVISRTLKFFSVNDPSYSHAGIIFRRNGEVYVLHCIGGEENPDSRMKAEKLSDFCSPEVCYGHGVYRFSPGAEVLNVAMDYYIQQLQFDTQFDLSTDDKMYCTELIYKILVKISGDQKFIPLTSIAGKSFVACDNIFLSPHATKIYSYRYQP